METMNKTISHVENLGINLPPLTVQLQTNRHTYSDDLVEELSKFAKIHEYDDRVDFRAAWQTWITEPSIATRIKEEVKRLEANGFRGDILERMYKSARYYYRTKKNKDADEIVEPRKEYRALSRSILRTMDDHIYSEINNNIVKKEEMIDQVVSKTYAAVSFTNYCRLHTTIIKDMLPRYTDRSVSNDTIRIEVKNVMERAKKTYKNRFYKIKVKLQEHMVTV